MYIAHYKPNSNKKPHFLDEHHQEVEKLAYDFASIFDDFQIARIAGFMHDIGKKSKQFQDNIKSELPKRGKVQHAIGGAYVLREVKINSKIQQIIVRIVQLIIAGHHTGIPNFNKELDDKIKVLPDYLKSIPKCSHAELKKANHLLNMINDKATAKLQMLSNDTNDLIWYISTLTRFTMSALVDADWLNTEEYFDPSLSRLRQYQYPSFETFQKQFNEYVVKVQRDSQKDINFNKIKDQVREKSFEAGSVPHSFFTLHAPTGAGKTLASLAFSLEHAIRFNKRRIVVALPLTNLTEQTSNIYRGIFKEEHVVEHHSSVSFHEEDDDPTYSRLASENWDRPFIVTTTVQLFETLFSNRPSKLRKLHQLAGSIIIIDEYQKLPLPVLQPIFFQLKILREQFNVTVLLMSATPLALKESKKLEQIGESKEILPAYKALFEQLQRVQYKRIEETLTIEGLVNKLKSESSVLCIVNTKKDAQRIYKELAKSKNSHFDGIYHISTSMCSEHRQNVLQEIISKSKESNIAVISTSALEAGVDISFPVVYRMMAPLDSIIQSAGRCNRYVLSQKGIVNLFEIEDATPSAELYEQSTIATKNLIDEVGLEALQNPSFCIRYFKRIYSNTGEIGLNRYNLVGYELLQFKDVNEQFRMIEDDFISVICESYKNFPHDLLKRSGSRRAWLRRLQPYMVSIHPKKLSQYSHQYVEGVPIIKAPYNMEFGIEM